MSDLAYPLHWPAGWPRTQNPQRNTAFAVRSVYSAVTELQLQLEKLKATTEVVISSNVTLGHATPKDLGVCVYFKIKAKPYVAGFYAKKYRGEDLTRTEVMARLDELLSIERLA